MKDLPQFSIPPVLARVLAGLPRTPPALALAAALDLARGRLYPGDAFDPLRGRCVALRVTDAGVEIALTHTGRGFAPAARDARPDVTIAASTRDLLALALRLEDADSLFFDRRLRMEGDTELGLYVKNTLDAIDLTRLVPQFLRSRPRSRGTPGGS